jgi:hypothetical protein
VTPSIDEVLSAVRSFGPEPRIVVHRRGPSPFPLRCSLSQPVPWSPERVEEACAVSLPSELSEFWNRVGSARLFEDEENGQWGLVVWSPQEVIERSPRITRERARDSRPGDLFVGAFLGDSDLLLVRSDKKAPDFGHTMDALPIDPRAEWETVGSSVASFLDQYVRASGDKYWEGEHVSSYPRR